MTARKKYSKEFKLDAIALVVEQQQSRITTYAEMSF
jgi:transposase-like protein